LGIVEAHGGTITLDDVPSGASFSIIMPIGDQQVAKIAELESDQAALSSRGKVLVIDDEEELAETIADMLRAKPRVLKTIRGQGYMLIPDGE